ncbi:hypothetical protein Arnit_2277 [Arcobacter nitrofigilis DSM 7299]|uniref:Uncharacterized protein n=1 Tax=Arcobacter nitrofigilis (strain ATCC 33309 / DSM 7299 / CCUG 15893 / LMG 7604 / NCTC 12251 / CI) TaxID=572480 RepID=D5V0W6_ARCNC|nr:hypothetical protein [Arcobacter nitrofigilis]ADG93928.1 hypothetical protein Arnit_2277 [Arcobacter nitrofigilis DSM 7299]
MKRSIEEAIQAKKSTDSKELKKLSKSSHYKVRRAVSRNPHTTQKTLKKLQNDPILNVAYMANKFAIKKITFKDSPSLTYPCVICEEDESEFHNICVTCKKNNSPKSTKLFS